MVHGHRHESGSPGELWCMDTDMSLAYRSAFMKLSKVPSLASPGIKGVT